MAQIANITVKKANGTTDVVYTALQGSAGDKLPAQWRSETASVYRANRPTLSVKTFWNGPRTARKVLVECQFPIERVVNGEPVVVHRVPGELHILVPQGLTDTEVQEAVHQELNLFSSTIVRNQIVSGYADN